jgi:hypothetical protein
MLSTTGHNHESVCLSSVERETYYSIPDKMVHTGNALILVGYYYYLLQILSNIIANAEKMLIYFSFFWPNLLLPENGRTPSSPSHQPTRHKTACRLRQNS